MILAGQPTRCPAAAASALIRATLAALSLTAALPAWADTDCEAEAATRLPPALAAQATECRVHGLLSPVLGEATLYSANPEAPRPLTQVPIARGVVLLRSFLWQGQQVFLLGQPPEAPAIPRAIGSVPEAPAFLILDTGEILATHLQNQGPLRPPKSSDPALLIAPRYAPLESFADWAMDRLIGEPGQSPLASLAREAPGPLVLLPLGAGRDLPSALVLLPHPPPAGLLTALGLPDAGSGATFLAPPTAPQNP
ncbi:MAG: hypothetical protein JXQ91_18445 [Vannielia sp.]|uniref:hypothetical protein n=1 Tax=Vannielia sp. TaxID=2813045 RepID=UPI003B8C4FAA